MKKLLIFILTYTHIASSKELDKFMPQKIKKSQLQTIIDSNISLKKKINKSHYICKLNNMTYRVYSSLDMDICHQRSGKVQKSAEGLAIPISLNPPTPHNF